MNKITINQFNRGVKKIKDNKKLSKDEQDFLIGWLKTGTKGPDDVLKAEMITQGV